MRDLIALQGNHKASGLLRQEDYEAARQILHKDGDIPAAPDFNAFVWRFDARR